MLLIRLGLGEGDVLLELLAAALVSRFATNFHNAFSIQLFFCKTNQNPHFLLSFAVFMFVFACFLLFNSAKGTRPARRSRERDARSLDRLLLASGE